MPPDVRQPPLPWSHLISKVLPNKHYDMTTFWRVPKEVNVVTDGFRGVAVVAYAVSLAWCLDVKSGCVDG